MSTVGQKRPDLASPQSGSEAQMDVEYVDEHLIVAVSQVDPSVLGPVTDASAVGQVDVPLAAEW